MWRAPLSTGAKVVPPHPPGCSDMPKACPLQHRTQHGTTEPPGQQSLQGALGQSSGHVPSLCIKSLGLELGSIFPWCFASRRIPAGRCVKRWAGIAA